MHCRYFFFLKHGWLRGPRYAWKTLGIEADPGVPSAWLVIWYIIELFSLKFGLICRASFSDCKSIVALLTSIHFNNGFMGLMISFHMICILDFSQGFTLFVFMS